MKTLLSIFSIITLSLSTAILPVNDDLSTQQLTFDGYEGGYYFFSDEAYQAVVLESDSELVMDLKNNDAVGEQFEVAYEPKAQTETSSSQGTIEAIKKIK
ncbi:MAG: hypothetical protein VX226_09175 [Bacteroidota bacterium]|nr:hypothetical protein [Bacteroidota bacterium]